MANKINIATRPTVGIIGFIAKHWFWIMFIILLLPSVINAVYSGIQEHNPTKPFFELGLKLSAGDSILQKDVDTLSTNVDELVGMAKPDSGYWKTVVYFWKFFWNVIFRLIGDVWFIFFPLVVIYRLVSLRGTDKVAQNFFISFVIFASYLFVVNTIILVHGVVSGNTIVTIPEGSDTFGEYFYLFKYMLPFHGIYALGKYLLQLIII